MDRKRLNKIKIEINEIETKIIQRINEELFLWKDWSWQIFSQINKNKEKLQINKLRDRKGNITTDLEEIQKIIRTCFKSLHSTKLENLKKMGKCIIMHGLQNQNETNTLNKPITINEIDTVITNPQTKESPGPDGYNTKFY